MNLTNLQIVGICLIVSSVIIHFFMRYINIFLFLLFVTGIFLVAYKSPTNDVSKEALGTCIGNLWYYVYYTIYSFTWI